MRLILALIATLILSNCAPQSPEGPVVLAAASLQGSLDEVADDWARQNHPHPVLSYAGTPSVARQIISGAPADIVFLADQEWMDILGQSDLIESASRTEILSNQLVIVAPISIGRSAVSVETALRNGSVAIAEPESVPAGRYAKAALVKLALWKGLEPRLVPTDNVRSALALAERGEVDAAIVYASDANASDKISIIAEIPAEAHRKIVYPAALVTGSSNPDAEAFLRYLKSDRASAIFAAHGFSAVR